MHAERPVAPTGLLPFAACAGTALALLGWAESALHTVSETIFLKRVGVVHLPAAFLASSVLLIATTWALGRYATRRDRPRLLARVYLGIALVLVVVWALVRAEAPGAYPTLILVSKQVKAVGLLIFWLAMGDLVDARTAKRLYGPLMAGLTLGTILGSFASGPLGTALGLESVIALAALALLVGSLFTVPMRTTQPVRLAQRLLRRRSTSEPDQAATEAAPSMHELARESRLFRLLATVVVCSGLVAPMLYFQFSYVADQATIGAGAERRLLTLYAQFWGWTNAAVLLVQLLVAGRSYRMLGIPATMALAPASYLLGLTGLSARMTLPAGLGAVAATRVADHAFHDPAVPVLYSLFPDRHRAGATTHLEGTLKRSAAALGNVLVLAVLAAGAGPTGVGYMALPIAAVWTAVAAVLWRAYPELLLAMAGRWRRRTAAAGVPELLDRATVGSLARAGASEDPGVRQAVVDMLEEAPPPLAAKALARLATTGSPESREVAIAALARLARQHRPPADASAEVVHALAQCIAAPCRFPDEVRVELVQAYGLLHDAASHGEDRAAIWRAARADPCPAVRLAALAADRRDEDPDGVLAGPILDTIHSRDPLLARTGAGELRALLLAPQRDRLTSEQLEALGQLLSSRVEPRIATPIIEEVAQRYGRALQPLADAMLALRTSADPVVRGQVLAFLGHAGLAEHADYLVDALAGASEEETIGARRGLIALGDAAVEPLIARYWFGRRTMRNAIIDILGELHIDRERLAEIYDRELDVITHGIARLHALGHGRPHEIVLDRLQERIDEGIHSLLLITAAVYDQPRIAELAGLLRRTRTYHEHAVLVEALEAHLEGGERSRIIPLLESGPSASARTMRGAAGAASTLTFEEAAQEVANDSDRLTRLLANATGLTATAVQATEGAAGAEEDQAMLDRVDVALELKSIPLFSQLTARQLVDLAALARQQQWRAGTTIFETGDRGDCMYLIVDGTVEVRSGTKVLATMGSKDFFGELTLFDDQRRSATVVTKSAVRLLSLSREDVLALMEDLPGVAVEICRALARRLRVANVRA